MHNLSTTPNICETGESQWHWISLNMHVPICHECQEYGGRGLLLVFFKDILFQNNNNNNNNNNKKQIDLKCKTNANINKK